MENIEIILVFSQNIGLRKKFRLIKIVEIFEFNKKRNSKN
jgi:hypothetical protein